MKVILLVCLILTYVKAKPYTEGDDYDIRSKPAKDHPEKVNTEIAYDRNKCTTCCRVILVSDWDYECNCRLTGDECIRAKGCSFNDESYDHEGHTYYVMDIEFNDTSKIKSITITNEAQMIPLRALEPERSLQLWELAAYKMINSYVFPGRNQDTRNGPYPNKYTKLIYWLHQPPLSYLSDAQKFFYVYPYPLSHYPYYYDELLKGSKDISVRWQKFPRHMYVITSRDGVSELCYQAGVYRYNESVNPGDNGYHENWEKWPCNEEFQPTVPMYQIQIKVCVNDEMVDANAKNPIEKTYFRREQVRRQEFTPIFA